MGASRVDGVDRLGDELQTCADDPHGAGGAKTSGRNHQRDRVEGNKSIWRIDEREDPEVQVAGLRLPQSSTLPRCNHVPPGRTGYVPQKLSYLNKTVKRQKMRASSHTMLDEDRRL